MSKKNVKKDFLKDDVSVTPESVSSNSSKKISKNTSNDSVSSVPDVSSVSSSSNSFFVRFSSFFKRLFLSNKPLDLSTINAIKHDKLDDKKLAKDKIDSTKKSVKKKKVDDPFKSLVPPDKRKRVKKKNRTILREYLFKAGFEDLDEEVVIKNIFRIVIALCLLFSFVSLIVASSHDAGVKNSLTFLVGLWTGVFAGLLVLSWIVLYVFLDLRIFARTQQIEDVLPDYLQLTSANISAGMPIDRALWFAVRPRFGILAQEMEVVAKSTISGEDLKVALKRFADKYDSPVLKRSINLLLVGMESGGEIADLLNKISLNIQETKLLKKEMAANVMTYAIFIGFATAVAAPILFGLSTQLLIIIQKIMTMLSTGSSANSGASLSSFSLNFSGDAVSLKDFRIFSLATLSVTSMFSAFIIGVIRKGSPKYGVRLIPSFLLATIGLYLLSSWALSLLLGGLI